MILYDQQLQALRQKADHDLAINPTDSNARTIVDLLETIKHIKSVKKVNERRLTRRGKAIKEAIQVLTIGFEGEQENA